jgi:hypothetical protein
MYILGLFSFWGISRICPAWSPLSINWLRLCPQSGARVRSHIVRRRLFIVLMTAAHISPNVFSLLNFLSNVYVPFLIIHSTSPILIIHHIRTSNYIFLFTWQVHSFISSVLHSRPAGPNSCRPCTVTAENASKILPLLTLTKIRLKLSYM